MQSQAAQTTRVRINATREYFAPVVMTYIITFSIFLHHAEKPWVFLYLGIFILLLFAADILALMGVKLERDVLILNQGSLVLFPSGLLWPRKIEVDRATIQKVSIADAWSSKNIAVQTSTRSINLNTMRMLGFSYSRQSETEIVAALRDLNGNDRGKG